MSLLFLSPEVASLLAALLALTINSLRVALRKHPGAASDFASQVLRAFGRASFLRHADAPGRWHLPGRAQPAPALAPTRAARPPAPPPLPSVIVGLLVLLCIGCTAPALVLQREAQQLFTAATAAAQRTTGHDRTHAALCREAAAAAEDLAHAGFPVATPAAKAAAADMRRDCVGVTTLGGSP